MARRIRIAVIAHEFSTDEDPTIGPALHRTTAELARQCDLKVFCLTFKYPTLLPPTSYIVRPIPEEHPKDVCVQYIPFPALPYLTRTINAIVCRTYAQRHVARWRPDLILGYFLYPHGCAASAIGKTLGIPVVLGARGSDLLRIPNKNIEKQVSTALRGAAAFTAVSKDLIRKGIEMGANPATAVPIQNGCSKDLFYPRDRIVARNKLAIKEDQRLVLFVGRLVALKGVNDLVHAIALLRAQGEVVNLACLGNGPMLEPWKALAQELGVADQVHFHGPKTSPEIAEWLGAADLLCLPSYSEGSPSVIMEALSSGRPVVATEVGGIPDLVDPSCGTLVPPRSPDQLAQAIKEVLGRDWNPISVSSMFSRDWPEVAQDTLDLCLRFVT